MTDTHAQSLHQLFDGQRGAISGELILCGISFGSSFDIAHGHPYLFKWAFGADKDVMTINFGEDINTYTAVLELFLNAENAEPEEKNIK